MAHNHEESAADPKIKMPLPQGASVPPGAEEEEPDSVHMGIVDAKGRRRSPWAWVPTAYFAEGIPYIIVMTLSVIMYKNLGISNALIGFWTSVLYLPWVVKPLWGPLVDRYWTKRNWIIWMQLLMGICFAGVAFGINLPPFFLVSLLFLWAVAFISATHDIACDGNYMLGLSQHQQAWFVGIRSTFYRLAMIAGTGLLPIFAGIVQTQTGLPPLSVQALGIPKTAAAGSLELPAPPTFTAPDPTMQHMVTDVKTLQIPAGETRTFHVRLALEPPKGKEVVATLTRKGDRNSKNIAIVDGERIAFTSENWDAWTTVTLKADPKIREVVQADISGKAGNIKLSWMVVFLFCAVMFIGFFLYHSTFLPHPKTDRPDMDQRPPFHQPVFWLFVAIAIPAAILVGMFIGLGKVFNEPFKQVLTELTSKDSVVVTKGAGFFFSMLRIAVIGLIVWGLMKIVGIRNTTGTLFNQASERSGIGFADVFVSFFKKDKIGITIAFLLLYRLGEAQLVKMASPFLLDTHENGGLALSVGEVGFVYGTVGIVSLTIGGILGGLAVATHGLKKWLWPMAFAINAPDLVYVYLSKIRPDDFLTINICVGIEQLGYGFGFTAYMLYMIFASQGPYKTAHFALTTGFMALGMMIPGMVSGFLQALLGYPAFFIAVCIFTIPGFLLLPFLPIDESFGRKAKSKKT